MSAAVSRSCAVATLVVVALWLAGTARAQGSDWPAPLPAQASAQQATTRQAGMTSADAADARPTNIFVSLRVNSPGDNGPVTQTSTTAASGDTTNDAATAQDAEQAQAGAGDVATPVPTAAAAPPAAAPPPKPAPAAVAERPAVASAPP